MVRPLKDLLLEADRFLSKDAAISKTADAFGGLSSEIASLADACMSASEVIQEGAVKTASSPEEFTEYEKLAMAANRIHASAYAAELIKTAQFVANAERDGYIDHQINEALDKIAAKKIKNMLPVLVGLEAAPAQLKSESASDKKGVSAKYLPNKDKLKDASKAVGE